MNTTTLTTSITIPQVDLSLLKDLAKKFGWTINPPEKNPVLTKLLTTSKPVKFIMQVARKTS